MIIHAKARYIFSKANIKLFFFRTFIAKAQTETGNQLSILRTDRGGEYFSNDFTAFYNKKGIQR